MKILDRGNTEMTEPTIWIRGKAKVAGGIIELDPTQAETYALCPDVPGVMAQAITLFPQVQWPEGSLLFDLAGLARPISASDAIKFVERHGLLRHGPQARKGGERFQDWEKDVAELYSLVELYHSLPLVSDAVEPVGAKENGGLSFLGQAEQAALADFDAHCLDLTQRINEHLVQVRPKCVWTFQIESDRPRDRPIQSAKKDNKKPAGDRGITEYRPGRRLLRDADAPDLVSYAFFELSVLVEKRLPLSRCSECSKFFILRRQDMQFCSVQCRGRARSRRFNERARARNG